MGSLFIKDMLRQQHQLSLLDLEGRGAWKFIECHHKLRQQVSGNTLRSQEGVQHIEVRRLRTARHDAGTGPLTQPPIGQCNDGGMLYQRVATELIFELGGHYGHAAPADNVARACRR